MQKSVDGFIMANWKFNGEHSTIQQIEHATLNLEPPLKLTAAPNVPGARLLAPTRATSRSVIS